MSADDWIAFLLRAWAAFSMLAILVFVVRGIRMPIFAVNVRRARVALIVSLSGWSGTQGYFAVLHAMAIVSGEAPEQFSIQALAVAAVAAIVGAVYVWAFWPFRKP